MIKKFLKSNWVITIVGGALSTIISAIIIHYYNEVTLFEAVKTVGRFLWSILNYGVSVWIIIVLVLVWRFIKKIKSASPQTINTPKLITFSFRGYKWIWQWHLTRSGWDITNLRLICPQCSKLMMFYPEEGYRNHWAKCPYCEKQIGTANGFADLNLPTAHEVRIAIEDKIRETEGAVQNA